MGAQQQQQQGEALPPAEEGSMLGRRSAPGGVFEVDARYVDLVGRDTFYGWLASQRDALFADERFSDFYREGWGRPSVPPSVLATALVRQAYEGVSDEETTARTRRRRLGRPTICAGRWRWAWDWTPSRSPRARCKSFARR